MSNRWRKLRSRVLTPDVSETKLRTRGFREKSPAAKELLERIGETFLTGYAAAVEGRTLVDVEQSLEQVPTRFRGFAYEGAGMGLAVLDGMPVGRSDRVQRFLAGAGDKNNYMVYVGVGWAMARLPRMCWRGLYAPDPLLRWLALDGYGFHQAYFRTDKYVKEQWVEPSFPWPTDDRWGYANRAIDQGIGRAMWFVGGTDPVAVADLIDAFAPSRRADLYSGAGLAATYAGGVDEAELQIFAQRAGEFLPQVAQASAFAAEARIRAGLLVPHTELAAHVLCGTDATRAAALTQELRPDHPIDGDEPAFELWRQQIASALVGLERSGS